MLKGFLDRILKPNQNAKQEQVPQFSQADVEALIDAKLKEHAAALENTVMNNETEKQTDNQDDYKLTAKQTEYALSLIEKVNNEFELAIEPTELTVKDLNRLIAYQRYKNKGTLINLVKKGVLRKK